MVEHFGRTVDPTQIRRTEFAAFRIAMAAKYAPGRLGKTVTVCRMMFRWAYELEIIETLPRFGPGFKAATKRATRIAKVASGSKAFSAEELRSILDKASSFAAVLDRCPFLMIGSPIGIPRSYVASRAHAERIRLVFTALLENCGICLIHSDDFSPDRPLGIFPPSDAGCESVGVWG